MLRLFPDRYVAALSTDELAVCRRSQVTGRLRGPIVSTPGLGVNSGEPWRSPLSALRAHLLGLNKSRFELELVLSDQFFQFVLVPWSDEVTSAAERESLARIQFETMFGNAAFEAPKISEAGYGEPAIACAINAGLLKEFNDLAEEMQFAIVSVIPRFMAVFNRWRRRFDKNCAFLVIDDFDCVLLCIKAGNPVSIRSFRFLSRESTDFKKLVERELLLEDMNEGTPVYYYGSHEEDQNLFDAYKTVDLQLRRREQVGSAHAMLLLGNLDA